MLLFLTFQKNDFKLFRILSVDYQYFNNVSCEKIKYWISMCFMKKVFRVFTLRIWNTLVLQKKNAGRIFNFLWRIKKLGHTFCYNRDTGA